MGTNNAGPARIKTSADLVFPKYIFKTTRMERLLGLKTERHKVLAALIPAVQQSFKYDCDSWAETFPNKEDDLDRYLDSFEYCERESSEGFIEAMQVLEGLRTETLTFIADSYNEAATTKNYEHITSAISEQYHSPTEDSTHDLNAMVKNAVAYSSYSGDYYQCYTNVFDDVRRSSPELDRPDLYNLTGVSRDWAARIMEVARFSREHIRGYEDETGTALHMNPELALLLKEDGAWVARTKHVMHARWLNASKITPDLMRAFYTEGARPLSEGVL